MFKVDLALNNLSWLMCHKTKPNQTKQITNSFPDFHLKFSSNKKIFVCLKTKVYLPYCSKVKYIKEKKKNNGLYC